MTAITWTGAGGDDNFNNPANWSPQQVPGAGDSVTISTAAATAINLDNGLAVGTLTTNKFVTLDLSNQSIFTLGSGSAGTFANGGTLALNSTNQNTDLIIGSSRESLTAGGTIVLSSNGGNRIYGAAAGDVLVNVNNTIEGGGQLGAGTLTLNNGANGRIIADDSNALILNTSSAVITNSGLLEATTGSGGLIIQSVVNDGSTGQVSAAGGNVYLQGGDLRGGTLSSSGGAAITVQGGNSGTLDGSASEVINDGTVAVNNQGTLALLGTIEYGTIALQSTNQNTDLVIGPTTGTTGTVYLTGDTLSLSDNGGNRIYGAQAGDTLSNQGTISGAGQLGTGGLVLINTTAKGVIDATGTNALVVNTGSTVVNQNALMEATNPSGGLVLQAVINNSSNGTILAAGANVYLQGADIQGGLVTSTGAGAITVQTYDTGTLDGTANAVTNTGTVAVNNQGTLTVLGSIVNTGLIALQSTNQATGLIVGPATGTAGTVTLSGAGTLSLSDNGGNVIIGAQAGDTLLNQQTIAGAGQFGYGALTLINQGTIDATGSNELVVNTGSTVANNSLMEATNPTGGLLIEATVANTGTLLANGANVYLQGADIQGGLLNSAGVGAVTVQTYQSATIDGSSATLTNAGQFDIQNQATLTVLGTLTNTGTLSLQSGNQTTELIIGSPTVTLTGGGVISLSDNGGNDIFGATASDVLDNVNNLIEGSGQLGDSQLTLINAATIDATGASNALLLTGETLITNTALIEATGAAGLYIQNTTVNDINGGTLSAVNSDIFLQNSTVQGGILSNGANAAIAVQTYQAATLDGSSSSVTNTGLVSIQNQATLTLLGTLVNDGTVALGSGNQTTELIAGSPTVTLTGSGTISLSNNGANFIFGAAAADTLDNVNNTIEGAGQLGEGQLTLINAVGGIIDANQSNTLTLNTAGETMSNAGLLESTGGGALQIQNTTVSNTGTILANGGNIYLVSSTLAGGLLKGIAGNGIVVAGYNAGTLDGTAAAVTIDAAVSVQNQGTLTLLGTMDDISGIALQSTNQNTDLIIGPSSGKAGTVTLFDNATITLSDNGANRIYGGEAGDTLLNVKNTIAGAGQLGAGQLTLINDSTIDATGANALILNTGATATNNGLMEATAAGGGGLVIQSAVSNTSGTMFADGGNVYLQGGTLIGGTLNSAAGASINVQTYQTGGLVGTSHAVTILGSVTVSNQGTLDISGSIINDGTIALQSGNQATDLVVTSAAATLTGGGTITLSDNPGNRIYGAVGSDVLDNLNNLIEGAGQLGAGQLTLQNHGTIDATGTNALVLSTGSTMVNQALMEATGPGGLVIQAVVNDSSGGTLLTAGGNIYLQGADIIGGKLLNSTGGAVTVQSYNSATLDGSGQVLTNAGTVAINNQGTLSLLGIIANSGTIALQSTNQTTDLIIAGSKVTVSGAGTITMTDNGANRIYGAAAGDVLDLAGGTITGAGQLGAGQLTLLDNGVISATGGNALILSLGGDGTIQGSGELLGIGSGGLSVQNGTYGVVGLVEAESGSSVTFSNGATLTNAQQSVTKSGTFDVLNGGTYAAVAGSSGGATLSIDAAAITGDYADIILSGAGSSMLFDGTAIENSLTGIGGPGTLQILGGRSYTTTLALTVVGTLDLGGGTLTAKSIKTDATSVVSGFGTIATVLTSTGTLAAVGGALELGAGGNSLSGTISGSGTLVLAQANTALRSGTVLDVATLAIIDGATLNLGGQVSFAGTFDLIGPGKLSGAAFTNTGLFEQTGTGNAAAISASFVNDGAILINAGGGIAFSAGLTNSGTITDNGIFKDTAALTGGTLNIGPSGAGAVIASGAGAGNSTVSTLTMVGGGLNTSGTTLTVAGDYVNSASGTGNGFKPFAGVTGTIDGQGTKLAVVGVDGTTITSVNGTLTITVAPGGSASFEIENTGVSGSAALRGALQTTVNGGNITGRALTGSGVTAQNFGPIAAGGTSGVFTIDYSSGPLSGEAIHIASDFANVAGLTIDIVAGSGSATPAAYAGRLQETGGLAATDWIAMHHG